MTAPPRIVAHRGWATRYPENTLPALRGALDAGVRHVEFDVQLSADGVPLLIHDPTLERTAGRPDCVFDLAWTQLAGVSVRRDEEDGAGVLLANLAQAAAMLTGYPDATAFVEIKRHSVERFGAADCVARCLAALGPVAPRSVMTSFEASVVEAARAQRAAAVAWVLREYDPPALETAGRACVRAFNVQERFFHIEFFETAPGRYVALEVNMRPPGGFTTDMFNFACDIDVYHLWAQVMLNGTAPLSYERKHHCCYASRKNRYNYRHGHDEVMDRYGAFMVQAASVPGVFSSALGDFGYIFRSPDLERIEEIIRFIHDTN